MHKAFGYISRFNRTFGFTAIALICFLNAYSAFHYHESHGECPATIEASPVHDDSKLSVSEHDCTLCYIASTPVLLCTPVEIATIEVQTGIVLLHSTEPVTPSAFDAVHLRGPPQLSQV